MPDKLLYALARPVLFAMDAEQAHNLTLPALRRSATLGLTKLIAKPANDARTVMGIQFPNPVGLAAGLDKDGAYIDGLAGLGFGSIEIGTVTPRAQAGNPKPRMFRLPKANAIINRMGFNNGGVDAFISNVQASQFYQDKQGVLGLNIGKNADTPIERAAEDYLLCLEKVYPYASYVTVNISSPNTKNLRQLQGASEVDALLAQLKEAQQKLADHYKRYVPLALKIAPDMDSEQIKNIAQALLRHKIDGVIATNTTITRDAVKGLEHAEEAGGLSGEPVFELSNKVIRALKSELGDALPIIGVGGIFSGADAKAKIDAGAALVQLYSGLIYRGPALVRECAAALKANSKSR
ncbi:quinone-dependent dihydroorotate dehydrogenase [Undibacterium sp. RTI2.1]|uniref:quinone-dependent dihydroorotate dehydrogenase n=1 Tax=unclassified Undibacterium TaxID=2630295 RepID=UPI002AB3F7CF|nr:MULTISPECIES: quinone-dependent dihydroorotate dehydrogenase [unclassified Undibacterium]MDY7538642.1 quinone-dependent dihydroorotate dehydrogenase [Undibacterium sp. 5I1]MEB0030289.1 quinone-dependent dihydroorotate dehydrogenase [Undibacterium sp. RTI2.1]MEB0116913.1 quinone-dependent dihydroorotate dehydrogenase [Undibacterium sp. RTI2.2]MEB0232131.1 quinone-dependent dihydroorotate dehydrogenase [Undibacterium sp. 10I3]MEB0259445.1 quinone-dependent dihydroorotate dehydrogenase [Undiba